MKKFPFLLAAVAFVANNSASQENNVQNLGANPPSVRWLQINSPNGRVIYPVGLDSLAFKMADIRSYQREQDASLVGPGKTKKVSVIVQNLTVFPEGFSTPAPWRTELYITPPQNLFIGPTNWTDMLTVHEYRHAQQFHAANRGFTWLFKPLMGQTGWLLNSLFNQPLWFREGDAVYEETTLTKGGRGRLPSFNMETKALLLSGYRFNYEKGSFGISLKNYVPNPYRAGYYMVAKLRQDFSDTVWQKILHDTYHRGIFYSFNSALKRNTRLSASQLYNVTMQELDSFWQRQNANLAFTPSDPITKLQSDNYINYRFPHFLPDGSLVCLKEGFDQIRSFVRMDSASAEDLLFPYGAYSEDHVMFSAEGNLLTWAEANFDPRWINRTYSVIKIADLKTGSRRQLTKKTRYFGPAPSSDGEKIAAVHVALNNQSSLVVVSANDGSLLQEWPIPDGTFLAQPRWFEDNQTVVAVAVGSEGNCLLSINTLTGKTDTLVGWTSWPITRPFVSGSFVYFSAPANGIDNIHAVQWHTRKIYQVSSVPFGAYSPAVSADGKKLVYSSYTANGYGLHTASIDTSSWKELNHFSPPLATQPYITTIQPNELKEQKPQSYQPKKYKALSVELFNFYGWFPYIGPDQFGLQLLTQNLMNTLRGSITPFYNTNEKAMGVRANLLYASFYPVVRLEGGFLTRRGADIFDRSLLKNFRQSWKEGYFIGGLSLPLHLTNGVHRTRLTIGGSYGRYNVDFLDSLNPAVKLRNMKFDAYSAQFNFSRLQPQARRHIRPRWGQSFDLVYSKALNELPKQLNLQAALYFPGLAKTHSLNLSAGFRREEITNTYRFINTFLMPRGYRSEPFEKIYVAGVNYEFPVWYPDFAVGGLGFFQQIRAGLFHDFSRAERLGINYKLNTTGLELGIDLRALRLFGMTVLLRYNHFSTEVPASRTPFQVFVTRFEIVN